MVDLLKDESGNPFKGAEIREYTEFHLGVRFSGLINEAGYIRCDVGSAGKEIREYADFRHARPGQTVNGNIDSWVGDFQIGVGHLVEKRARLIRYPVRQLGDLVIGRRVPASVGYD